MRAERALRIPLQIGTSGLLSLARASAFLVPGIILVGIPTIALIYLTDAVGDTGEAGGYVFCAAVTPGLLLLAFAYKHARRAHAGQPSDLVLDAEAFTVSGGPLEGRRIAWSRLKRVAIETPPKPPKKKEGADVLGGLETIDDSDLKQLVVYVLDDGDNLERKLVLAAADHGGPEQQSLKELAKTLGADRGTAGDVATRALKEGTDVALLSCTHCGAVVVPASQKAVPCGHCGESVTIPADMRDRVRDAEALLSRPDAVVAKLLDQPSARFVGRMYTGAAVFMIAAWPAALMLLARNYRERALGVVNTGFVLLFVAACIVGFFALIRGRLVDRQALRLVTLDFAAQAPATPGEPYLCRSCGGPLPDRGDHVLVGCLYCHAENILGIDLGRDASAARGEKRSLEAALALRRRERRRWRGITVVALLFIALAVFSLRHGIGHNAKTWPSEQRCEKGDLAACVELADMIGLHPPPDVRPDSKRAATLYHRACDAQDARACESLAELYSDFVKAPRGPDGPRAAALLGRACDLGRGSACRTLARQYEMGDLRAQLTKNAQTATELYRRGCAAGDSSSCQHVR